MEKLWFNSLKWKIFEIHCKNWQSICDREAESWRKKLGLQCKKGLHFPPTCNRFLDICDNESGRGN